MFCEPHVHVSNSRAIFSFSEYENEVFWKYYHRLGNFVGPNHGIELWYMCLVVYEGLNVETRMMMESMSNGGFIFQSSDYSLVEKTLFVTW